MPQHNFNDLTGQIFGRLTVVARSENNKHGRAQWHCQCACGQEKVVPASSLMNGEAHSCGCLRRDAGHAKLKDLTGQVFGRLTVLSRAENRGQMVTWHCECVCGERRVIHATSLSGGQSTSCGCLTAEIMAELGRASLKDITGLRYGHWTVKERIAGLTQGHAFWLCRCDCGTEQAVNGSALRRGHSWRCRGCYARDLREKKLLRQKRRKPKAKMPLAG